MSNDFSTDDSCYGVWRLESDGLLVDSKRTNTLLTSATPPTSDIVDFKEGSGCADFNVATYQYFYIPDANLCANFPFKNGDLIKKGTICCWFKLRSVPINNGKFGIAGKVGYSSNSTFGLISYGNEFAYQVHNNYYTRIKLDLNIWYHAALAYDGSSVVVRLYRSSDGKIYNFYDRSVSSNAWTVEFRIGGLSGQTTNYTMDGKVDEVVIFNRSLSVDEIDAIRNNEYSYVSGDTFRYDIRFNRFLPIEKNDIVNSSFFTFKDVKTIDGLFFNNDIYLLGTLRTYSDDKICNAICLLKLVNSVTTLSTQQQAYNLIQGFIRTNSTIESMRWYGNYKFSGKNMAIFNNKLMFALVDTDLLSQTNANIYSYDGTTVTLAYTYAVDENVGPVDLKVFDNNLYICFSDHILKYDGVDWTVLNTITLTQGEIDLGTYLESYSMVVHENKLYLSITKKTPNGSECVIQPYLYTYDGATWELVYSGNVNQVGDGFMRMTSFNNKIYFIARKGTSSYCEKTVYNDDILSINTSSFEINIIYHMDTVNKDLCFIELNNDSSELNYGGFNYLAKLNNSENITSLKTLTSNKYFVNMVNVPNALDIYSGISYYLVSDNQFCCEDI